jgi:transcriptional regulator with XRE-family HTH domain
MRIRTPKEKLAALVEQRGRQYVLDKSGLSKQYLSNLLRGQSPFGQAAQNRMEALLGLPAGHFSDESASVVLSPTQTGRLPSMRLADVGRQAPGDSGEFVLFPADLCRPGMFAVVMDSVAMVSPVPGERSLPPGAHIAIDPEREPKPGDFVLCRIPGQPQATLRKLIEDSGVRYLSTLNPDMRELVKLTPSVELLGTACGVIALL